MKVLLLIAFKMEILYILVSVTILESEGPKQNNNNIEYCYLN